MILSNNYLNNGDPKNSPWSHNQPDNGTFELYHNGRNFFPDSGVCEYYSYSGSTAAQTNARRAKFRSSKIILLPWANTSHMELLIMEKLRSLFLRIKVIPI